MNIAYFFLRMVQTELVQGLQCQLFTSTTVIAEQRALQGGIFVTNVSSLYMIESSLSDECEVNVGSVLQLLELFIHNLEGSKEGNAVFRVEEDVEEYMMCMIDL